MNTFASGPTIKGCTHVAVSPVPQTGVFAAPTHTKGLPTAIFDAACGPDPCGVTGVPTTAIGSPPTVTVGYSGVIKGTPPTVSVGAPTLPTNFGIQLLLCYCTSRIQP